MELPHNSDGVIGDKMNRREFATGLLAVLGGLAGVTIVSQQKDVNKAVETVMDHKALLQQEISGFLEPLGYEVMIFDRDGGGYNVHVAPNNLPDTSEVVEFDDSCLSRMAGCILRATKKNNTEQPTPLTVYFSIPESSVTNRGTGAIERLKTEGVEIGEFIGGREFNAVEGLPKQLHHLESITLPGMSAKDAVPSILKRNPLIYNINTGPGDDAKLSPGMVQMLRGRGRESVRVNGKDIKL